MSVTGAATELKTTASELQSVIIVGGGIAGLYCAYELAAKYHKKRVAVLEIRSEFGGRIETGDLRGFVQTTPATRPTFKAEFGPMRFEFPMQLRLEQLLKDLGITVGDFTPPASPPSLAAYPIYPDEYGEHQVTPLGPLELLKLGVYRMFGKKPTKVPGPHGDKVVLVDDDLAWLQRLRDDAPPDDPDGFERLRRDARSVYTGRLLHEIGFSNALEEGVLSPGAVKTIENEGTFYHLIPQNPNAVEWAIFWLRLFKLPDDKLWTIPAGVQTLTQRLQARLEASYRDKVRLHLRAEVTAVQASSQNPGVIEVEALDHSVTPPVTVTLSTEHLILALPKSPLKSLASSFPPKISGALDDVTGFNLVKIFLAGRAPAWWPTGGAPDAQTGAWLLRTREVHYFRDASGINGMTMLYMDESKSAHWVPLYIQAPENHDKAEYGGNFWLKVALVRFLLDEERGIASALIPAPASPKEPLVDAADPVTLQLLRIADELGPIEDVSQSGSQLEAYSRLRPEVKQLMTQPQLPSAKLFADVTDYAIRDWSQKPFGAAFHVWRLGAKSWEVRSQLRAFSLLNTSGDDRNAHICGEAYSDYQGFIEGSLRSAADAVATIVGEAPPHSM